MGKNKLSKEQTEIVEGHADRYAPADKKGRKEWIETETERILADEEVKLGRQRSPRSPFKG